jgi:hypothetical protein
MKTIEVTCECPKSDITSMTEAFFGLRPGTLSKTPQEKEEENEEENESNADYIPGYDDGEAEPSNDEPSDFE